MYIRNIWVSTGVVSVKINSLAGRCRKEEKAIIIYISSMLTHIFSKGNDGKKKREQVDYVAVGDGQAARSCLLELSVLNLKKKKKKKTSTKNFLLEQRPQFFI